MENYKNSEKVKSAEVDANTALFKNRKRPRLSPQKIENQNENKYRMAEEQDLDHDEYSAHKYSRICESFRENLENGFITNSIADCEPVMQTASSSKNASLDDVKCESIELYTNFEPQEGRPILNTSMIRYANQNQSKARSPLTAVDNQKSIQTVMAMKKSIPTISSDDTFNYYQRKMPQNTAGADYFSRLSYEMLLSIFQWLPKKTLTRCSLVCKRFYFATQDETLWGRLDLAGKCLNVGALGRILRRGVVVFRLAQSKIMNPIFVDEEMLYVKLQYLDLSMAVISKQSLAELLGRCKNLKKLSLETLPIDASVCEAIADNRQMEALNLTMCTGIDENGISTLFPNLKSLQNLNISWTSLNSDCIAVFLRCSPISLLRLNIAGCRQSMTDLHITDLVLRCPSLIELNISDCVELTSNAIVQITKLKHLEYLSMSRCYKVNTTTYASLNQLSSLAYLDIFGVLSDEAIKMLQQKFSTIGINKFIHSAIARPTVGTKRTSIWGLRTRDHI